MSMPRELVERELTEEGPRHGRRGGGISRRRRSVTVNLAESPLGWLHAHGHLDDRLFAAGEALRKDYERAQVAPSIARFRTRTGLPVIRAISEPGSSPADWIVPRISRSL